MTLHDYLDADGSLSVRALRERMVAFGSPIKSDAQIRQWRYRYAERHPSPLNCVAIEKATDGKVTRQELRPHDWAAIWPELVASAQQPPIPASAPVR